ncbi:MAG: hypothetical protein J7J99_08810 [Thermoprotei archaeon]|nr:hypothetical protein [Thermoprotei archaeon]
MELKLFKITCLIVGIVLIISTLIVLFAFGFISLPKNDFKVSGVAYANGEFSLHIRNVGTRDIVEIKVFVVEADMFPVDSEDITETFNSIPARIAPGEQVWLIGNWTANGKIIAVNILRVKVVCKFANGVSISRTIMVSIHPEE